MLTGTKVVSSTGDCGHIEENRDCPNLPSTGSPAAAAKSLQSCPTLFDPIDGSPPGSPICGILQTRTLGWVAIFFSNAWKWNVKVKSLSCAQLLATPWTAAYQAPPSMGFSRQEYWSGVPLPSPRAHLKAFKFYSCYFRADQSMQVASCQVAICVPWSTMCPSSKINTMDRR